jgi:hypothetical protein
MQGIFPPVGYHKFRQNYRQCLIRMQFTHRINVGEKRTNEGPVRRLNYDKLRLLL